MSSLAIPSAPAHASDSAAPAGPLSLGAPVAFPPFDPAVILPLPDCALGAARFHLAECRGAGQRSVQALIRDRFAVAYEARVRRFMPRLFSLRTAGEEVVGAFGLREAARGALFLERYLDQPIEAAIAAATGSPVDRDAVVEVGQFAGTAAGAFRCMIQRLTERLHGDGHRWVVFTGTQALRNAFTRLGLRPLDLGPADPARLPSDERADWGHYYEHGPRVMCGDIAEGYAEVVRRLASRVLR